MEEFIIPRIKLVEIPVTSITGFLTMPTTLRDLNNSKICSIVCETATTLSTSPQNRTVVAAADIPNLVLVLKHGSDARIDQIPLYELVRGNNAGHFFIFQKFVWNASSSGVQIMASGTLATTQSICLSIAYIPLDANGNEQQ